MYTKHLLLVFHVSCSIHFMLSPTATARNLIEKDDDESHSKSAIVVASVKQSDDRITNDSRQTFLLKKQKWSNPPLDSSLKRVRKITKRPTNTIHCKIFCRSGYHLQILPSGLVRGTVNQESEYVFFEMQSFGPSLVKLMNTATRRYLTMKRNGTLRGVRSHTNREALFKETHEQNAFNSYASHRYYRKQPHDMLVGIKRNGSVKRATKTLYGQTATQFLVIQF